MMILEAKRLGFYCAALDPDPDCPCRGLADEHVRAGFDDVGAVLAFACGMDFVTFELEHVGRGCLTALADSGAKVFPDPAVLLLVQDKLLQKTELKNADIPVPRFTKIRSLEDVYAAGGKFGYPLIIKACSGGYDGKGNALADDRKGAGDAFVKLGGGTRELMAEEFVIFDMEISVLACRAQDGGVSIYPLAENRHENGVLIETRAPAAVSEDTARQARAAAGKVMDVFKAVGMFCVEMFVTRDGGVVVNEVAPRPHNSGHYTIDACLVNQFESHVRAVAGLPLADHGMFANACMRNILGSGDGEAEVFGAEAALALPGVKLHVYGKRYARKGRKMGHLTAVAQTVGHAAEIAARARAAVRIGPSEEN
jgi:5-(carboxyamino)imidazole ribonucleotide synthase